MKNFKKLIKNEEGATAIEYGLMVSMIALAALGAMTAFGNNSSSMWNRVESNIVQD